MSKKCTLSPSWKQALEKRIQTNKQKAIKKRNDYLLNPNFCNKCKMQLCYEKRQYFYCSRKCSSIINNEKRSIDRFCLTCKIKIKNKKNAKKYCSHSCQQVAQRKEIWKNIEEGKYVKQHGKTIRDYLFSHREAVCEICKLDMWQNQKIPLDVDHIDGDANNNLPSNLRLICKNCHALTPTFGNKNRGKGRKHRYRKHC
jgi:hypothetical protein